MHFLNKISRFAKHYTDTAVIVDSKGEPCGKIIVRYTRGQFGTNSETGVIFHDNRIALDCSETAKRGPYDRSGVFDRLTGVGAKVYDCGGRQFVDRHGPNTRQAEGISSPSEFVSFRIGNRKYKILWV